MGSLMSQIHRVPYILAHSSQYIISKFKRSSVTIKLRRDANVPQRASINSLSPCIQNQKVLIFLQGLMILREWNKGQEVLAVVLGSLILGYYAISLLLRVYIINCSLEFGSGICNTCIN